MSYEILNEILYNRQSESGSCKASRDLFRLEFLVKFQTEDDRIRNIFPKEAAEHYLQF